MMKIEQMDYWKREKRALIVAFVLIAAFLSPLFILGENAHFRVHDNMDSNIAWYKVLHRSGQLFGPVNGTLPQIINGLPRNAFGTEFSGIQWLYTVFPTMTAYALSQTITRVFAFIGMYLLLKRFFVTEPSAYPIRVGVALAFALTPFWPSGMLSTLGMPLALWAFLTIRSGRGTWREWLVLFLLPFYSSFVLGFFFFLTAMALLWLYDLVSKRKFNGLFLTSIGLMTLMYLIIEYRLVYSLVFPTAPTSRNEFLSSTHGLRGTAILAFKNYIVGHGHVLTLHTLIILPFSFIVLWKVIKMAPSRLKTSYLFLFVLNIVLSCWYAFWFYKGWEPLKARYGLLNTFNFARFHFLRPLVIYMMFAIGAAILWPLSRNWRRFVNVCIAAQVVFLFAVNPEIYERTTHQPTFKQFYAEREFKAIRHYIGKPPSSYRVVSIGIHPAIAQYNGFYTLDTYNNFYPLTYKHAFRKIIAGELNKDGKLEKYFDHWGGRCYVFVSELGKNYEYRKTSHKKIHHLQFNTAAFKKMGGDYVLSAVPILNAEQEHLHLLRTFNDSEAFWKIYLYQAK